MPAVKTLLSTAAENTQNSIVAESWLVVVFLESLGASYVSVTPKRWPPSCSAFGGGLSSCYRIRKTGNTETLNEKKDHIKNKGGRPPKAVKKDQLLGVKCTLIERRAIEAKARSAGLSRSEYLREMGLTGKIDMRKKALPKEVLKLMGNYHHLAANINQIAKKRNQFDDLNALDRSTLNQLPAIIKEWDSIIKSYLK